MSLRVEWLSSESRAESWRAGLRLHNDWDLGVNLGHPPAGLDEFRALRSRSSSNAWTATAVGFIDGEGIAIAECKLMRGVNSHRAVLRVLHVQRDQAREGVSSDMLGAVAEFGSGLGYSSLSVWAGSDAEASFYEHHGLVHQTTERHSRLEVGDVDTAEEAVWAKGERASAAGYQLVRLPNRCPEELLDAACASYNAEQDLPLGDLDYTLQLLDHDGLRSMEADLASCGLASFRAMALAPDGTGAGITELCVNTYRPQLGIQGTTAVVPQHRGQRIGRWLKAVNLLDTRAAYPQLQIIDTNNAEANPWMLDINTAMGFRHHHTSLLYGCSLEALSP